MKIVMWCNYVPPAKDSMGSERVAEALTKAYIELGHEVVMLVRSGYDKVSFPVVTEFPEGFDIIHGQGENLERFGIPWVSTVNGGGSDPNDSPWKGDYRFICVSDFIRKLSGNPYFVHACVDQNDFIYKEEKQDYFAWIAGTDWGEGKGLFTAIQLAKQFGIKLKIAGTGKNKKIIEHIKLTCDDKIEYVGAVNGKEKSKFLANAKALLFYTRLPDACPLTVSEALISGTPIIGSTNGSLPELIVDGKTGILCNSERELPKALLNIKKIKPFDCRQYALNHFSNIVAAKKYLQIYEDVIKLYKGEVDG